MYILSAWFVLRLACTRIFECEMIEYSKYCFICKTSEKDTDVTFHHFPKNQETRAKWIKCLGRKLSKHGIICSRHFRAKDFYYKYSGRSIKKVLVPIAVPSLLLNRDNRNNSTSHTENEEVPVKKGPHVKKKNSTSHIENEEVPVKNAPRVKKKNSTSHIENEEVPVKNAPRVKKNRSTSHTENEEVYVENATHVEKNNSTSYIENEEVYVENATHVEKNNSTSLLPHIENEEVHVKSATHIKKNNSTFHIENEEVQNATYVENDNCVQPIMSYDPQSNGEIVNGETTNTFGKIEVIMDPTFDNSLCISKIPSCNNIESMENMTNAIEGNVYFYGDVGVITADEMQFNVNNIENPGNDENVFGKMGNVMDPTFDNSLCISKILSYNNSQNIGNLTNLEGSVYFYEDVGIITPDGIQFNVNNTENTGNDKDTFEKIKNAMDPTFDDSLCVSEKLRCDDSESMKNMKNIENNMYLYENTGDKIQCNNTENTENDKDTKKLTSKRKMSKPLTGSKRFCSPQSIEDLQREDFTSNKSWQIVCDYIQNSKKQHRILNKKMKRLGQKVKNLQSLLSYVKESGLLSNEICKALDMSCNFA